jgi:hypothetical protein
MISFSQGGGRIRFHRLGAGGIRPQTTQRDGNP